MRPSRWKTTKMAPFNPREHLIKLPRKLKDKATGTWTTVYDEYLEVKWRVLMFREQYPHGIITTEEITVDLDRGYARFKATVADGEGGRATGYGTETQADFGDYAERAETRALGRALAVLGFGTQFVGQDLTEGEHIADAPVAQGHGPSGEPVTSAPEAAEGEARITQDEARTLKKTAQTVFGYVEGERRLRADLGFEVDEKLTLRHLAAHVTATQYAAVMTTYDSLLRQQAEADVPDHVPPTPPAEAPAEPVTAPPAETTPVDQPREADELAERQRWSRLSRRSMAAGLSASVWEVLRMGDYQVAETMIAALETSSNGAEGRDGHG
jgi:hypothetical protein